MRRRLLRCAALVMTLCACRGSAPPPALELWHTFGPDETGLLNESLAEAPRRLGVRVEATLLPFGRARARLLHALGEGRECPDLARVDATWLPQLAERELLAPLPDAALAEGFLPEALELARWRGQLWGLPQSVDGLALIVDRRRVPGAAAAADWPPEDLAALERAARALTGGGRYGLSLRSDGYWFVAWLRASGGDVLDPERGETGMDREVATRALARYAQLAAPGGVAPAPSLVGDEAAEEAERFAAGEVAIVVGGPWTVAALYSAARRRGETLELEVAPYPAGPGGAPAAPRGGQLWVVPRCADRPGDAWRLAVALTAPELQARWSRELGLVPTRVAALEQASPVARGFAAALSRTRPLPRHPLTPLIFDDLTPAVQAVVAGDASAEEALAGVHRAWRRLLAREGQP